MIARSVLPALLTVATLLTSCNKPEVASYRVPKESSAAAADAKGTPSGAAAAAPSSAPAASSPTSPQAPGGNAMADTAVATAGGPGLTWTAPAHWKAKPGSAMRKGSFAIAGDSGGEADLAISAFPGDVGGDLANLNRWRGQIQMPPVSQAEFEAGIQRIEHNGLRMTVVDVAGTGTNAQRILGAMIPYGGATWFVKLIGPDALVAKEKSAFMTFLSTIQAPPAAK